jgi:dephospho-CoA kinase
MIDAMLASQWPIGQKIALADHVIWNDGSEAGLRRQASLLLQQILPRAA